MRDHFQTGVLEIPSATSNLNDAAQYMIRHGVKQYNLCGEFCVAYCTKDRSHISNVDEFLDYWEAKDLKWYQQVFKNKLARTTGIYDLDRMLGAYEYDVPSSTLRGIPSDPFVYERILDNYLLIIGVNIDHTGYIVGRGIPHWVVVEKIHPASSGKAYVEMYNPFTNNMEPYSWRELMNSSGSYKQGIWVERIEQDGR